MLMVEADGGERLKRFLLFGSSSSRRSIIVPFGIARLAARVDLEIIILFSVNITHVL